MHQLNQLYNHHIKRQKNIWNFDLYLLYIEDNNLLDYNQHQLMKRAPTLITRPNLVFLAPTKKWLRNTILKCKILLASLMSISDCHQSASQPSLLMKTVKSAH